MGKRALVLFLSLLLLLCSACASAKGIPADGEYTIAVTLAGGSGRAGLESPAALTVKDGVALATVVWSSPFYDFMLVNDEYYYPVQEEGNAVFVIPVVLDEDMAVSAQTLAMSEPHIIDYTLHFDSASLKPSGGKAADFAALYWCGGAVLCAAVAAAVILAAKKKKRT